MRAGHWCYPVSQWAMKSKYFQYAWGIYLCLMVCNEMKVGIHQALMTCLKKLWLKNLETSLHTQLIMQTSIIKKHITVCKWLSSTNNGILKAISQPSSQIISANMPAISWQWILRQLFLKNAIMSHVFLACWYLVPWDIVAYLAVQKEKCLISQSVKSSIIG